MIRSKMRERGRILSGEHPELLSRAETHTERHTDVACMQRASVCVVRAGSGSLGMAAN